MKTHGLFQNDAERRLFHGTKADDEVTFHYHCPVKHCQYGLGAKKHFSSFSLVKQHYVKVHAERKFPCSKCGTLYVTEKDLKRHLQRCGILYRCGTCPIQYTTKEALLTHCKRQSHTYPQEYTRQTMKKAEKRERKNLTQQAPEVTIITQPILLVPVQSTEVIQTPKPVRELKPKPVAVAANHSVTSPAVVVEQIPDGVTHHRGQYSANIRQDALIQTDIYGIHSLSVSKNEAQKCSVQTKAKSVAKKISPKRKLSRELNPSSPRRKKSRLTTGIQTAVSLTKKKGIPIVNSTQTTGDYIIETALRHANIQVEKREVASQVTPNKNVRHTEKLGWLKPKPILVDSYSQVKEQHIKVETGLDYAESETMTDLPLSISTQTPQSYLEKLLEKDNRCGNGMSVNSTEAGVSSDTRVRQTSEEVNTTNTLIILNESLQTSVNYEMQENWSSSKDGSDTGVNNNSSPAFTAVPLADYNARKLQTDLGNHFAASRTSANIDEVSVDNTASNFGKYIQEQSSTTDMEAQAMSASEFDKLLQSSGIFLHNNDVLVSPKDGQSTVDQDTANDTSDLANELDFLATATIDTNTQTADFNLFDSVVPVDSNTQTGDEGLDFLDMVTTNMETQTLNEADLINLGLLDSTLSTQLGNENHCKSSDTSLTDHFKLPVDDSGTSVIEPAGNYSEAQNILKVHQYKSSKDNLKVTGDFLSGQMTQVNVHASTEFDQNSLSISAHTDNMVQVGSKTDAWEGRNSLGAELGGRKKVQMETQTVSLGTVEPLAQTETQTQVEMTDTDFETINMETQTTFDDLQQFCEWLQ